MANQLLSLFLGLVTGVLVPVVGAVLIAGRATGRSRNLGLMGCIVLAVVGLLQAVYNAVLTRLYDRFGSVALTVGSYWSGLVALVGVAGLVLLIMAVVARSSQPDRISQPPAQPSQR